MARIPTFERNFMSTSAPIASASVGDAGQSYEALNRLVQTGVNITADAYEARVNLDKSKYLLDTEAQYKKATQDKMQEINNNMSKDGTIAIKDSPNGPAKNIPITEYFNTFDKALRSELSNAAPFKSAQEAFELSSKQYSTEALLQVDELEFRKKKEYIFNSVIQSSDEYAQDGVQDIFQSNEDMNIRKLDYLHESMLGDIKTAVASGSMSPFESVKVTVDSMENIGLNTGKAAAGQAKLETVLKLTDTDPTSVYFRQFAAKKGYDVSTNVKAGTTTLSVDGVEVITMSNNIDVEGWKSHPLSKYIKANDRRQLLETVLDRVRSKKSETDRILDYQIDNVAQWLSTPEAHKDQAASNTRTNRLNELYPAIRASGADPIKKIEWLTKLYLGNMSGGFNKQMPYLNPEEYLGNRVALVNDMKEKLPSFISDFYPEMQDIVRSPEKMAIAEKAFANHVDQQYQSYRQELERDGAGYGIKYNADIRKAYVNWKEVANANEPISTNAALENYMGATTAFQKNLGQSVKGLTLLPKSELDQIAFSTNEFANDINPNDKKLITLSNRINQNYAHRPEILNEINRAGANASIMLMADTEANSFTVTSVSKLLAKKEPIISLYNANNKGKFINNNFDDLISEVAKHPDVKAYTQAISENNPDKATAMVTALALHAANLFNGQNVPTNLGIDMGVKRFINENYTTIKGTQLIFANSHLVKNGVQPSDLSHIQSYLTDKVLAEFAPAMGYSDAEEKQFERIGAVTPEQKFKKFLAGNKIIFKSVGSMGIEMFSANRLEERAPLRPINYTYSGERKSLSFDIRDIVKDPGYLDYKNSKRNYFLDIQKKYKKYAPKDTSKARPSSGNTK